MSTRTLAAFSTIRTEGAMLPSDILVRVASGDKSLGGLEESSYHLSQGEKIGEATNRAWNRLQAAWANFQSAREKLAGTDTGTSLTRERWLLPLFQLLDYGRLQAAKAEEIGGKSYTISHSWQQVPIHLVGCNVDLDRRIQVAAGGMRSSPHSLLQELLNRSDQHLWGIVSNGLRLRLLRDNISLTRQAYVEFDLEAMMAGEAYPDFVLLWLLLHQSRFESERPEACQLEKWSQAARTEGVRVLDGLRDGVQRSIEFLGQGFLAHPANGALRERLRSGTLDKQDYYRQILRLVYRLLFLFVADDRDLLLVPTANPVAQKRYRDFYATTRLRHLATTRAGSRHHDLYCGLKLVMGKLSGDGCTELALPALGSFLFSPRALPDLNDCDIANLHLLEAIRSLAVTQTGQSRRVVDYKNLGAEELGSVYESLLELHPDLNAEAASFELKVAAGSERKKTGSYYTPTSLISCLLDSALDPVLAQAAKQPVPETAVLNLKIVDPACGSGHFLIAAAHRIARQLAAVRTGEPEPPPDAQRKALRDVIGRCIYGVDLNPMAVELCKVSLWMEALEPGKPLSFLEHRIQVGNSLLGTTPHLLELGIPDDAFQPIEGDTKQSCTKWRKVNKSERKAAEIGAGKFAFEDYPWLKLGNFSQSLMKLDNLGDDTIAKVRAKTEIYEEAVRSSDYLDGRLLADTWCAAFVWRKDSIVEYPITEEVFRRIERNPHGCEKWMRDEIQRLAGEYRFFHWHIAFPDVFLVPPPDKTLESQNAGWSGGFDCVLGNPPWERIKLQEKEWFASSRPDITGAANASARRKLIAELSTEDPTLYAAWLNALRKADGESHLIRNSGRYPLCGVGDVNTYAIFAETNRMILAATGRVGCIVPSGIAMDNTTRFFFQALFENKSLASFFEFENQGFFMAAGQGHMVRFALMTITGPACQQPTAQFLMQGQAVSELTDPDRRFELTAEDIALLNPNTRTSPLFRTGRDAEIAKAVYRRVPAFIWDGTNGANPWGAFYLRLVDYGDHAEELISLQDAGASGFSSQGWHWSRHEDDMVLLPVYESKFVSLFDLVFSAYSPNGDVEEVSPSDKCDPNLIVRPRYLVKRPFFEGLMLNYPSYSRKWFVAYRDVTDARASFRTVIATAIPRLPASRKIPVLGVSDGTPLHLLLSNLDSYVLDFIARQKIGGLSLSFFILKQLPILPPTAYKVEAPWNRDAGLMEWLTSRTLELCFTNWALKDFAAELGWSGAPFVWNDDRRFLLRCELDAAFFHLYLPAEQNGQWRRADAESEHALAQLRASVPTPRDAVAYIMDTFPIVKRREEEKWGEYRTKRVVLEIYDALAEAERTGAPYQTRLSPPPAEINVAHRPVMEPTQTVEVVTVSIADLVALPTDAFATPLGVAPENVALFALIDVLRLIGGEIDPQKVRIAAILVRKPALAAAFMDDAQAKEWFRLVGREARPLKGNVIQISQFQHGAADHPWADAISQLKGSGGLVAASGKWSAGDRLPLSSGQDWISGRASVAVQLLGATTPADAEQGVIAFIRSVEDGTARRAIS